MKKGCIVGYGAIGPVHKAALDEIGAEYAVCDCNINRLEKSDASEKYTDFDKMLENKSIDVVHVCTPHYLHVPMAKKALESGKHVVLEKPVGISSEEVKELFEYKGDREICIMLQNRKNPAVVKMKQIIDSGSLGELKSLNAFLTWHRDADYYATDAWRGKWGTEGGGLLINQAVHILDLVCWMGGGYKSLSGGISTRLLGDVIEVEDTAEAIIETESGVKACFYATNCSTVNSPMHIEACFDEGTLRYSDNLLMYVHGGEVDVLAADSTDAPGKSYWGTGHKSVISEFYDYLDGKCDTYMKLENATGVTRALFDFYKNK